jgi:Ca2+-binding EF-hand superfamily protein
MCPASIKKGKIAQEVRDKQKAFEMAQKEETERMQHEQEKKMELVVDYEFTEEIRERAVAKMTLAAKRYDKNHPSAVSLDAFNGAVLAPAQFKEVLKMTFGLKVNSKELGALVREFDKNGDGNIECSEFLITFFKLGFAAREQEANEQREKQRLLDIQAEEERAAKLKAQEDKMELRVDYDFSEADEARMHAKLKEAAKKYDKNHPSAVSLEGFDAQFLTPGVFREMLRRTFNMSLTGKELGAAVKTFDKTGDSTIPCRDFLVHFFQIGYAERNRDRLSQMAKQRELDTIAEQERHRKLKAADEKEHVTIAEECAESDRDRAINKLRVAASKYDKNHPSSVGLDGFDGKFMKPGVFREMVKRTFNVLLDPRELLAMVTEFDSQKNNTVNCADFLKMFFKMGFEERFAAHANQLEKQRAAHRAVAEEAERREREKLAKHDMEVDYDYTEEDRVNALEKMTAAAIKYDKNHASAVSLVGFEGAFMSPYVFKDQIFRTFGIKLTPKELGALMKHFDRDGDGTVDCSEFLLAFFKLGFDKRSEWHKEQLVKQRTENRQREREAALKLQEQENKMNLKLDWDFTDEDLDNVKKRMTTCAMKYDKNHPASVGLEGFEAAILPPGVFREMVKRTFNISLNPKELAAMLTLFGADRDGNIKTAGFLTKFMRIGLDERYKFKTESIEKQRAAAKAAKKEREEKIAAQWKRVEDLVDVDYEFTREDEDAAMVKLVDAAAKYDKASVSAPSLDGFSTVYLGPGAFKEMLKRTFNFRVNGRELGALVKKFEHPEKQNHVDCQMFVINFLSIGFAERRKMKVAQANIQRENERHAKEEHERKIREAQQRNELMVDYDFGEVEKRKALEKLTKAAFKYDKNMPGAVSLAAFDAAYLVPGEFKEILKRTFNLRLEPCEFGAIMQRFDPEKTGKVHSKDFLNEFFRIGFAEREKMKLINIEKNRMAIKLANQEHARKLADAEQRMVREVKSEFTLDEQRSAFKKLTVAATKYDKNHPSAVGLDGFDASTLTYGIFRELIKKCFNVILSDGELAAVKTYFDKKNEGFIRSKDFLVYFFKLGFAERNKFKSEQLRKDRELAAQREREEQEKLQAQWAKMELNVDWDFADKDTDNAMAKITKAAKDYDPNHPAAMSLSAFDGATMTPAVFREMLKRVMGILLTDKELGAVIALFDKEGNRLVSCPDFILRFKELGFTERARERKENFEKRAAYLKQVEEEQAAKEKAKEDKREDYVNYNFSHEEFSTAMEKLKYAASTYDKNHPSAVGLDGFQGASLTPGIFREMLKRTFGIKLSPGELGATVKFFDSDGDGTVDSAEFLKHFYKLQRVERSHIRRQRIQAERDVQMKLEAERKEL